MAWAIFAISTQGFASAAFSVTIFYLVGILPVLGTTLSRCRGGEHSLFKPKGASRQKTLRTRGTGGSSCVSLGGVRAADQLKTPSWSLRPPKLWHPGSPERGDGPSGEKPTRITPRDFTRELSVEEKKHRQLRTVYLEGEMTIFIKRDKVTGERKTSSPLKGLRKNRFYER